MIWTGEIARPIGYGEAARNYLMALASIGRRDIGVKTIAKIDWRDLHSYSKLLDVYRGQDLSRIDQRVRVSHGPPDGVNTLAVDGLYNVAMTVWETSALPGVARFGLNQTFDEVWVPSTFNRDVFVQSRVKKPVYVMPHAVAIFQRPAVRRPTWAEGRYVFLSVGSRNARKNPQGALRAYLAEFHADDPVVFVYKSWSDAVWDEKGQAVEQMSGAEEVRRIAIDLGKGDDDLPAVVSIDRPIERDDLMRLHAVADCCVSSHRGEGFGLAIIESKAIGNRVVATNWSGPCDFLDPRIDLLVDYDLVPVTGMQFRPGFASNQMWAEPRHEALREALRKAATEQRAGSNIGLDAFTLEAVGRTMAARVDEIYAGEKVCGMTVGRPLRKVPTVMVSTFNDMCGIGIYSEELARALLYRRSWPLACLSDLGGKDRRPVEWVPPYVRTWQRGNAESVLAALDGREPGVLHIQHEFGFFRDEHAMRPLLVGARERGWKTVVTMHTILPAGLAAVGLFRAILDNADAVVALGAPGAAALRQWGGTAKVVHIPQGCVYAVDNTSRPEARQRMDIPEDRIVCLHFGFITRNRRISEIIDAVALRADDLRACKFQLIVAGGMRNPDALDDQKLVNDLRVYAHDEGVDDIVRISAQFLPDRDLPVVLHSADFAVLHHDTGVLSDSAAFATLRAYGVPVAAADVPALSAALDGGAVMHSTVDQMADNLVRLASDAALRTELRERQKDIADGLAWENIAAMHEELYRSLYDA